MNDMNCPKCGYDLSYMPEDSIIDRYCPNCSELVMKGRGEHKEYLFDIENETKRHYNQEPSSLHKAYQIKTNRLRNITTLLFIGINLISISCLVYTFLYGPIQSIEFPLYVLYDQSGRSLGEFGFVSAVLRYIASFIDLWTRVSAPFEIEIFFYMNLLLNFFLAHIVREALINSRGIINSFISYAIGVSGLLGFIFMSIAIGSISDSDFFKDVSFMRPFIGFFVLILLIAWFYGGATYWDIFIDKKDRS